MRALLGLAGLAALAASVDAQITTAIVTPDTATGSAAIPSASATPRLKFKVYSTSVDGPLITAIDPVAPSYPAYVSDTFLASGNWVFTVDNAIATIVFLVSTNPDVAQMGYRTQTIVSEQVVAGATDNVYKCDPCVQISGVTCNDLNSGTRTCANILPRRYTYSALMASTSTAIAYNAFGLIVHDTVGGQVSFTFRVMRKAAGTSGDPQISGMQGQDFQVHGVPDEVFNMITYPNLQVNARFVYLSSAECVDNYTACFAHPGTYISEEGIRLGSDKIHVRAGSAKKGLTVSVNGQKVVAAKTAVKLGSVEVVNHRRVVIKTPIMSISISNSDKFLNQETELYDRKLIALGNERRVLADSEKFHPEVPLHGLQGQTWRNVEYPSGLDYEGSISDYQIQDGNLFGTNFVFNQFSQ